MADDLVEMLHRVPLFADIPLQQIVALAARLRRRQYRRNEVIFHQGDPAGAIHIIQRGKVKVTLASSNGGQTVLAMFGQGACFGEMAALDGGTRSATLTAVEATDTLALPREDLLNYVRENSDFALALIITLTARLRRADEWLEDAYFQDLDTRMARRLIELCDEHGHPTAEGIEVRLSFTQSDLGGMIGATRVSVNRLLGVYQDQGILRLNKGSMTILQPDALHVRAGR